MLSFLLQLDAKAESELKEENDEDYAMNSESYLEVMMTGLSKEIVLANKKTLILNYKMCCFL